MYTKTARGSAAPPAAATPTTSMRSMPPASCFAGSGGGGSGGGGEMRIRTETEAGSISTVVSNVVASASDMVECDSVNCVVTACTESSSNSRIRESTTMEPASMLITFTASVVMLVSAATVLL
jgi:hypothetical protein